MLVMIYWSGSSSYPVQEFGTSLCEEDVKLIKGVKPSVSQNHDWMRQTYSKSGAYTMKSGYHVQHQMDKNVEHDNQVNLPPSTLLRNILATKIWKLSIPPKIRIFWWKILHNGLPVVENLSIREINKLRLSAMWRKNRKSCHLFFQLQV